MNITAPGLGALLSRSSYHQQARPQPSTEGIATTEAKAADAAPSASKPFNVKALTDNLWGFVQGRLADAQASGASEAEMEKLWQAAEKGLEKGFFEAKSVLKSLGRLDEPLNEKIDQAYSRLTETLKQRDVEAKAPPVEEAPAPETSAVSRGVSLYQYRERTFTLDVATREGDRITIHVQNSQEASAEQHSEAGWSQTRWGQSESDMFSLRIEGDLSEQERDDLDRLLGDVNTLANEFYDGDIGVAWEQAQAIDINGSSLASMDLNLRSVETRGAAAYQRQARPEATELPRGLAPLQQYARDLVQAQTDWQDRFSSDKGFFDALDNHPRNDGRLAHMARELLN